MIIDIIATIPLIAIAYLVGYHRGHVHALAVPYAMLAEKMEELMRQQKGTIMKTVFIAILISFVATTALAQCAVTGNAVCNCSIAVVVANPELEILFPWEDGPFMGLFIVQTKNIEYIPELATNPVADFAIGVDAVGGELRQNEGHIHGWIFALDADGQLVRSDTPPSPVSYLRFYGAGGAEFTGDKTLGLYTKPDSLEDLPPGKYRIFFQAQLHDHTAMRQLNAPAFPPIASRDFFVWGGSKSKSAGKGKSDDGTK